MTNSIESVESQKKIEWITVVQIISMALIVAHHSISKYCEYPSYISEAHTTFGRAGAVAFMFASGYLLSKNNSIKKYGYAKYLKKRAVRLLTPYVVIQLALFLPKSLIAHMTDGLSSSMFGELFNIFLRPSYAVCPHLWFLPALFILNAISPALFRTIKNKLVCITFLLAYFIISNIKVPYGEFITIFEIKLYLIWYALGVAFARYEPFALLFKNQNVRRFIVLLSLFLFVVIERITNKTEYRNLGGIVYVFSLLALIGLGIELSRFRFNLDRLGKFTFPVYILSLPIQNVFETLGKTYVNSWIATTLIMFASGLVFPVVVTRLVKFFESFTKTRALSLCIGA